MYALRAEKQIESGSFTGYTLAAKVLHCSMQIEFTAMRDQYMRCGEGFVICYAITDRRSLEEAAECRKQIERVRCSEFVPMVLVGNKCDLESSRQVSTHRGRMRISLSIRPFRARGCLSIHAVSECSTADPEIPGMHSCDWPRQGVEWWREEALERQPLELQPSSG